MTPKDANTAYTGTAKSAAFTVAAAATDPTYTITIPATVDLKSTDPVNITASGVTLNEGQKIIVTLDSATYTTSGSEFSAKDKSGESVVKYKINDGAIGLDDANKTVAEFTEGGSAELSFAVTDETGIKFAGEHSEELTFGISVEDATVAVTGVSLDKNTLELTAGGDTATLTADVLPDDATDKTVTWSSDNEAVATVVDGVVTPVAKGTATITARHRCITILCNSIYCICRSRSTGCKLNICRFCKNRSYNGSFRRCNKCFNRRSNYWFSNWRFPKSNSSGRSRCCKRI